VCENFGAKDPQSVTSPKSRKPLFVDFPDNWYHTIQPNTCQPIKYLIISDPKKWQFPFPSENFCNQTIKVQPLSKKLFKLSNLWLNSFVKHTYKPTQCV